MSADGSIRPRVHVAPLLDGRKGRGTLEAVAHRFERWQREPFDDGWADAAATQAGGQVEGSSASPRAERGAPAELPIRPTEVTEQQARSILTRNDSPDIGFELSVNPYRGCEHGCIYCYARPSHAQLDLSPGIDFETRIVARTNAASLLREAFDRPAYVPRALAVGTVTDAYQPAERRLRLTRAVVEVLAEYRHAFSLVTKSALVERDLDLIAPLGRQRLAAVHVTLTTLDAGLARRLVWPPA